MEDVGRERRWAVGCAFGKVWCIENRDIISSRPTSNRFEEIGFGYVDDGACHGTSVPANIVTYLEGSAEEYEVVFANQRASGGLVDERNKDIAEWRHTALTEFGENVCWHIGVGNYQLVFERVIGICICALD